VVFNSMFVHLEKVSHDCLGKLRIVHQYCIRPGRHIVCFPDENVINLIGFPTALTQFLC
jgi:hypothetical protein